MTNVLALAIREITERKLLFLGAALVGVITLLVPLMPLPGIYPYRDVVDTSAFVFAVLLVAGGGIVLGATTIGRDLSNGRLAFFFTRQLHAWEIWSGRILGMFMAVALAVALVSLPATLIGGGLRHFWELHSDNEFPPMVIFVLMFPLAAHYVSVAIRSRSAWLGLDIVALCAAAGTLWTLALPFLPFWFGKPKSFAFVFALLALFLGLAGWAGLAKGRITPIAVHRWSAITLWSLVAVTLVAFAAWRTWVFSVKPNELDLSRGWAHEINGNGEWFGIRSGESKGRGGIPHEFVMSEKTGAWLRVDAQAIAVSADRRVAVIAKRSFSWRPSNWIDTTMQMVDLTAAKPKPRDLGIVIPGFTWDSPALSADGSRLAVIDAKTISIYSLADEKLLAAFSREKSNWTQAKFLDLGVVQTISTIGEQTVVSRYDIATRQRVSRHELEGSKYRIDPNGERVAVSSSTTRQEELVRIHDARTGDKLGEVRFKGSLFGRRFLWLSDGGFALGTQFEPRSTDAALSTREQYVSLHHADGTERLRVPLPGAKQIVLVGEQKPGELLVVWSEGDNPREPCSDKPHVVAIDLVSGSSRVLPIDAWPRTYSWTAPVHPGSVSTRLFSRCDGTIVSFDAATGETRTLLRSR